MPTKIVKITVLNKSNAGQFDIAQKLIEASQVFCEISSRSYFIGLTDYCEAQEKAAVPFKLQVVNILAHRNTKADITTCLNIAHAIILVLKQNQAEPLDGFIERIKTEYKALSISYPKIPITLVFTDDAAAQDIIKAAIAKNPNEISKQISWGNFTEAKVLEQCLYDIAQQAISDNRFQAAAVFIEKNNAKLPEKIAVKQLTIAEQLLATVIAAILAVITASLIYNPMASLYAATQQFWRTKNFKNFGLMLVSPLYGPFRGIFVEGLVKQGQQAWQQGLAASLQVPHRIFKQATLEGGVLNNKYYYLPAFLSKRDLIFSLLMITLIIGAILSVIFLPASVVLAMPTLVAYLQFTGLSIPVLALLGGLISIVTATFLYEMSKPIYDSWDSDQHNGLKTITEFNPPELKNYAELTYGHKIAGSVVGALLSLLPAAIIYNPLATFYKAFRKFWREELGWDKLIKLGRMLVAPLQGPLRGIFYKGIYQQSERGWQKGFIKGFKAPVKIAAAGPEMRDVVASLIVACLITGVVLSVLFPPVNIALLLPAFLATIGLSSLSTGIVAVVAAAATFILGSFVYGIGSQIYDCLVKHYAMQYPHVIGSDAQYGQGDGVIQTTRHLSKEVFVREAAHPSDHKITVTQGLFSGFSQVFSCLPCGGRHTVPETPLAETQEIHSMPL